MHTFAQERKVQQTTAAKSAIPGRAHFGERLEVNSILSIQRTIGNQAVQRLLRASMGDVKGASAITDSARFGHDFSLTSIPSPRQLQRSLGDHGLRRLLQTKLAVSTPRDPLEQAADRVADEVLRMSEPPRPKAASGASSPVPTVQRMCAECEEEITGQPLTEGGPLLQANPADDESDATAKPQVGRLPAGGEPLAPATRALMEPRFVADFARVRLHTNAQADRAAEAVGTLAYTVGPHIVFRAGQYQPASAPGHRLLAPELTHVVQQRAETAKMRNGLTQTVNRTGRTLQRQPAAAGRREARITVVFDEDSVEFYHRVIRAIQRSVGFRGVQVSFGQPFYDPILAGHRRLALAGTKTGSRVTLRASAFFDPEEFHEQLTDGRVEIEQEARLRESRVTGVLTPRDNFVGRSLTQLGLAEVADLSFTPSPAATAADLGGLRWDLYDGAGTLTPSPSDDGTAVFTAGATPGRIVLDLLVTSGLAAGRRVATLNLRALAPNDAIMEQIPGSGVHHLKDHCGVGFCGRIFLRPVDVSFQNIQFSEGDGIAEAKGFYKGLNGASHCQSNPCNVPWSISGGNSTTGCKVWMVDTVATASNPPPFAWGYRLWPIDWQYRVGTGSWVRFTVADQLQTVDSAGRATISKKGSTPVSRDAADPTSIVDCSRARI